MNLVSDLDGVANFTDPNLVNPWGLGFGPTTPFWVADNGAGVSTLYTGLGKAFPPATPLVVTIPSPTKSTGGAPSGLVFNSSTSTTDFMLMSGGMSGAAIFLFATEDGTILGWNPTVSLTSAVIAVNNSGTGAVYKGLAISTTSAGSFLYAANFSAGVVEMYDSTFKLVKTFTDPGVDTNFAPFGIQNINGTIFVTFALQQPDKKNDQAGPGNGFVDMFAPDGTMKGRLASHGTLNSPWGLAMAPSDFGLFSGDILVGNFGDGRISAFDTSGNFKGQLFDPQGNLMTINRLWSLQFGTGAANNGPTNQLFFTAGIGNELHGLFGFITTPGP